MPIIAAVGSFVVSERFVSDVIFSMDHRIALYYQSILIILMHNVKFPCAAQTQRRCTVPARLPIGVRRLRVAAEADPTILRTRRLIIGR